MAWQDIFHKGFGPGALSGITLGDWLELLVQHRFRINIRYIGRAATISGLSVCNSILRLVEVRLHGQRIERQHPPAPVFIIGAWRSGTTHLHNLLSVDDRFSYPTLYSVTFPHWFLSIKLQRLIDLFIPKKRWSDNVAVSSLAPSEDEFALCQLARLSPMLAGAFPRNGQKYQRYFSFEQASQKERERWQSALVWFVKKMHVEDPRPLLLKSPQHTARIRLILEVFPDARFVHIRRNPWRVFQSCEKMRMSLAPYYGLQRCPTEKINSDVINGYKEMYDCFFQDRHLIPDGQFHETSYEELVQRPMREAGAIYEALNLPDFDRVQAPLHQYLASIADYRINRYPDIPIAVQEKILRHWERFFDEWGYSKRPNESGN